MNTETCARPGCDHTHDLHSPLAGCTGMNGPSYCPCSAYVGKPPPTGTTIPARNTDPATSKRATPPPIKAGTQRAKMLSGFGALGPDGGMSETAAEAAGVPLASEYAKRTSELSQAGLVRDTGQTAVGASGQERIIWQITQEGRDVLSALGAPIPPAPEKRRQITLTVPEAEALQRLTTKAAWGMRRSFNGGSDTEVPVRSDDLSFVCAALAARDDKPARRGA